MILQHSASSNTSRIARIMVFPLFVILFCSFGLKIQLPSKNAEQSTSPTIVADTLKEPEFKGGPSEWANFLVKNLKYPKEAQDNKKEANVFVTFTVNTDGTISDETLKEDPGHGLGEEALRVIRLSSGKWEPATENGNVVKAQKTQPFAFRLNK